MRADHLALGALALATLSSGVQAQRELVVSPDGPIRHIGAAVRQAQPGDRIRVTAGAYREPTIIVDKPLAIVGDGWPTIDGEGARELMRIIADDVTVRGIRFANVGASFREDRAAVRVSDAAGCVIENNRFDEAHFGIYLAKATRCRVVGNVLRATAARQTGTANGIHLWSSTDVRIERNAITGHRDGIYLEFSSGVSVENNRSTGNRRYGLHFMFSNDCAYRGNRFAQNDAGVAVMYASRIVMTGNTFAESRGGAAYGLLLKDIVHARVERNRFVSNTTALQVDGTTRLVANANLFERNGWAVRLDASAQDSRFTANVFTGNTFDVATNSAHTSGSFIGNYWDRYGGYDLDRDGIGDVPHRPVRLFAVLADRFEPSIVLLDSFLVRLLEAAERLFPSLTPTSLFDPTPAMRPRGTA